MKPMTLSEVLAARANPFRSADSAVEPVSESQGGEQQRQQIGDTDKYRGWQLGSPLEPIGKTTMAHRRTRPSKKGGGWW